LFELPALGDAPDALAKAYVVASNAGLWKPVPVELATGAAPLGTMSLTRRAVLGRTESMLDARAPAILDNISTVVVSLFHPAQYLLNADDDALTSGANLAMIGDELLQFGRADQLSSGVYRLSRLLRGRRGTEWAALTHVLGDRFCMIDAAAMRTIDLPASAVAATLAATAHGIGDSAPLPSAERTVFGESLRPPSPCQLAVRSDGSNLFASWTRRSHRGWNWTDGIGVAEDPFPELYRLRISGPDGDLIAESTGTSVDFEVAELPGGPGEEITLAVAMIGPAALSHPAVGTITI
jgi:hypothetical protein